jgi:truncated hemoglobin YjbI
LVAASVDLDAHHQVLADREFVRGRHRDGYTALTPRGRNSHEDEDWAEALGGPTTFSAAYGDETSVGRIHSGNGLHEEMDRRAIACFDEALKDVGLADDDRLRQVLHEYFTWATTTTMSRYHRSADDVPDGLEIPQWSWEGLAAVLGPTTSEVDRLRLPAKSRSGPQCCVVRPLHGVAQVREHARCPRTVENG